MARFMIKASEYKNVCKAVNDRKLAELKKEIIEILKKQDEKEVKKAIDYFNSQELHYTHLEKSFTGKWVEKAGYGIGTVRIWKGKKYKKIAPGKWARVFDKEGRGTNIAIGKLIARVNKIDNVEDLMAFVMANKQRFVDENGIDLPVLDKLRAAVDARNNGDMGSKGTSKPAESKKESKEDLEAALKEVEDAIDNAGDYDDIEELEKERKQILKKLGKKPDEKPTKKTFKQEMNELYDAQDKAWEGFESGSEIKSTPENSKKFYERVKKFVDDNNIKLSKKHYDEIEEMNGHSFNEALALAGAYGEDAKKNELARNKEYSKKYKGQILDLSMIDEFKESEAEKPSNKEEKQYKETKKMLEDKIAEFDEQLKMFDNNPNENTKRLSKDVEKQKKTYVKMLENLESEYEKTQNRSDAMKGNQNARKYGLTDEQIEYYDIQEVVEEINGYPIVKNSEGKYSFVAEGRVKDRPEDFETNIDKVKERINDHYETEKNIKAAKNYDFKNAKLGSDVQYTKKNNGNHLYFKKSPDGSKAISVTVNVSDMREPLNMVYEVSDTKSGESWQYETAYGNKEGLEWAVERPEQMEKELKKFFKRDPNKEWEKQNTFEKETVIDRSVSTNNPENLKPIAKSESVGEGKVKIPYSKEVSDEIKHLTNTSKDAVKKGTRYEFLTKIYYDKGNLVSTDGNKLKIVKVGELDGIESGTFVDIDNTKDGITITADKEFSKDHKFPQYERVIPQDNNEKIVLDNKALISKIRDLKKDGGITTKNSYVTLDIQGNNLMLDGVKVGDVSAAEFEGDNSDFINLDADILTSYLSGDKTELFSSKDTTKAMYFGNGSAINVIMPQTKTTSRYDSDGKEIREIRRKDYDSMRKDKEIANEAKENIKAATKKANQDYVDDIVNGYKRSVPANFEEKSIEKLKEWTTEQLQRMYKVANADIDSLMEKKAFNTNAFSSYTYKHFDMSPRNFIGQNYAMKEHPAIVRELERLLTERGEKIEKSLFDGFLGLELLEEDINDEEEDIEERSLWNDYSAEQPELFNSVELQVREAMNRRYGNCL